MKIVLQRVSKASVSVEGKTIGAIDDGFLILLGVSDTDTGRSPTRWLINYVN